MTDEPITTTAEERPPYRPPIGVPMQRQDGWGAVVSVLVHVLLVLLLISPIFAARQLLEQATGAGGRGPAGGGGGGRRGQGGYQATVPERVHYFQTAPAPSAAVAPPVPSPPVPKPVVPPKPKPTLPVVTPPPIEARVENQTTVVAPPVEVAAVPGTGGGTGTDGSRGNGPGTGGGIGTGTGTGRGSGTGPGTGGGEGVIFPATPDFILIPPMPVPKRVQGRNYVVTFAIDSLGKIESVDVATGDDGYDKVIKERWREFRFRPAHRADGTPVPSRYDITFTP
jgi:hypothetical protein